MMKKAIEAKLRELERAERVKIVYACESGSRAWGFASKDSDYDVRFIYIRPLEWYLAIDEGRDVIERPIDNLLDINGWDLKKALKLFRKSNPPLFEWLNSPFVYMEKFSVSAQLRELMPEYYSPLSCSYHYLHMARGNYREFLKGETVWIKKYFYVLRPILACKWIQMEPGPVPMKFERLLDRVLPAGEIRKEIDNLLERKRNGEELDSGAQIAILNGFIETELASLEASIHSAKQSQPDQEKLNRLFYNTLQEVWKVSF